MKAILVLQMREYFRSRESGVKKIPTNKVNLMGQYQDLLAFKKAYDLAMQIFVISKKFPQEEKY